MSEIPLVEICRREIQMVKDCSLQWLIALTYLKGVTLSAVQTAMGKAVGLGMTEVARLSVREAVRLSLTEVVRLSLAEAIGLDVTEVVGLSLAKVVGLNVERLGNFQLGKIEDNSLVRVIRAMAVTLDVGGLDDLLSKIDISVVSGARNSTAT